MQFQTNKNVRMIFLKILYDCWFIEKIYIVSIVVVIFMLMQKSRYKLQIDRLMFWYK